MSKVTIENPVINSPFEEPERHFKFNARGITEEIADGRRRSEYFMPFPKPKKRSGQDQMQFELPDQDLRQANAFINSVRTQVTAWRNSGYPGVTPTTRRLLEHWNNPENEPRLFFCQHEAVETAIYLNECDNKQRNDSLHGQLVRANAEANPDLFRIAFKMATGSGKTVVMAMLIVYHTLNKIASPKRTIFADAFLIVAPGVTIRDRLQVLYPEKSDNDYQKMNLVPRGDYDALCQAKIVVTNYHAFQRRKKDELSRIGEKVLGEGAKNFTETPEEMVIRVCRGLGKKKNIIVLNDEAHHCYRPKKEQKSESKEDEARLWINGLEAVKAKIGVKQVYDLSATPFFLKGSGYATTTPTGKKLNEGVLFPWVVSDFALIDAIECGIAKVPRVPVADDAMKEDPIYRRLWDTVRPKLSKIVSEGEPQLPQELETALQSLYSNYEKSYDLWQKDPHGLTPPVLIVVCNNTKVSKLVYDWIAGWEKKTPDGENIVVKGNLSIFNNEDNGVWSDQLNTILIDSKQLESGEALSNTFKRAARTQIEQFRRKMNVEKVTDGDLLREVMNTVGKKGELGEQIKCVVSVSMLSEGWDAKRVTHILGVRAFSTQLLCEQVVGRGLRRSSHDVEQTTVHVNGEQVALETFPPEYAEVYGVPFSFIPATGSGRAIRPGSVTEVEALPERQAACEITFPIIAGYRRHRPPEKIEAIFTPESRYELSTAEIPARVEIQDLTGESKEVELPYLTRFREQETEYSLANMVMERHLRDDDNDAKWWLFPQVLRITRRWMKECVTYKDNMYPQYFHIGEIARKGAFRIYQAILRGESQTQNSDSEKDAEPKTFLPIFRDKERTGSTEGVAFETTQPTWETRPDKCHISHVVADTDSWEQKTAQALEQMDEVVAYVKNHNLDFTIPYTNHNGMSWQYVPDFITRIRKPGDNSGDNIVHLILETSGREREDKLQKVNTVENMWLPAVNSHSDFGEWAFLEITDPWDMQNTIREFMSEYAS
ncbi:restriction endonuclease subunit R [Candidatus Poribacteria bacterium]|nr:restriction endonuclease subunit R [Candidatus Poribacteria bacterium]MYA54766.1 restriction endonuclease subunit R [Candidatus Poribacteria bacterium]